MKSIFFFILLFSFQGFSQELLLEADSKCEYCFRYHLPALKDNDSIKIIRPYFFKIEVFNEEDSSTFTKAEFIDVKGIFDSLVDTLGTRMDVAIVAGSSSQKLHDIVFYSDNNNEWQSIVLVLLAKYESYVFDVECYYDPYWLNYKKYLDSYGGEIVNDKD